MEKVRVVQVAQVDVEVDRIPAPDANQGDPVAWAQVVDGLGLKAGVARGSPVRLAALFRERLLARLVERHALSRELVGQLMSWILDRPGAGAAGQLDTMRELSAGSKNVRKSRFTLCVWRS